MERLRARGTGSVTLLVQLMAGLALCLALMSAPTLGRGFWDRAYRANLPMPTLAAWNAPDQLPVIPASSKAGIGCYLGTVCPAEQIPQALVELERLPVNWARTEIPWAGVEPSRGVFNWKPWDQVVNSLHARHYRTLGMLCYWNSWSDPYSDEAIEAFGGYAERVARRYRGRVAAWEIWNEPNDQVYWKSTPGRYVRLMRAAYEGVKRGNPEAIVVGGSLSGVDLTYLRQILDAGGAQWMDFLSVHPYSFGWEPEDALLIQELRGAADLMVRAGKPGRLWVTEIGTLVRPARQAQQLERTWTLIHQSGVVDTIFWFCLYQPGATGYSIFDSNWKPKPSVEALRGVVPRLRDTVPIGSGVPADLQAPWAAGTPHALSPLQAWGFRRGEQLTTVRWCPEGEVAISRVGGGLPEVLGPGPCWETTPHYRR